MTKSEALDLLTKEYLDKCMLYGCDSCFAEYFCIENNLRNGRYPEKNCVDKIKVYLKHRGKNK